MIYLILWDFSHKDTNSLITSDGPMIDYNRKSVDLDSWTDDQSQS